MTIQILHYEFMGPIRLDEWGPPMEEVVYILLARSKDKFSLIYADQCAKSDDVGFFTKNPRFKCWMDHAGTEGNLYVAVYPMFGSPPRDRLRTVGKIVARYLPPCNAAGDPGAAGEPPQQVKKAQSFVDPKKGAGHYVARYLREESYRNWFHKSYPGLTIFEGVGISEDEYRRMADELIRPDSGGRAGADAVRCACCGSSMALERRLQRSDLYRCGSCGISETRLK